MSKFLNPRLAALAPYVPGEQPRDDDMVKLNTNESPFAPSPLVAAAVAEAAGTLNLYPPPDANDLVEALAKELGVQKGQLLAGNGSDELLAFCFLALCPNGAAFPDLTYGFYPVYCGLYGVESEIIPLEDDFSIDVAAYANTQKTLFIANPNAPTGIALPLAAIETLLGQNPERLVVVDEAYVDFGTKSAVALLPKHENLLVVGTFSKSRQLAGGRLGYAAGCEALIEDLARVKYSFNPYNVNTLTQKAALATLRDAAYHDECRRKIMATRARVTDELRKLGFTCTISMANFVFVTHAGKSMPELYRFLRGRHIYVRRWDLPRTKDHLRVTIGTDGQMDQFLQAVRNFLEPGVSFEE